MLSKKTLKIAIDAVSFTIYKNVDSSREIINDLTEAYSELKKELKDLEARETCSMIVETETKNMNE